MIKKIIFLAIGGILLTSCASNGWKCNKRYCANGQKHVVQPKIYK